MMKVTGTVTRVDHVVVDIGPQEVNKLLANRVNKFFSPLFKERSFDIEYAYIQGGDWYLYTGTNPHNSEHEFEKYRSATVGEEEVYNAYKIISRCN